MKERPADVLSKSTLNVVIIRDVPKSVLFQALSDIDMLPASPEHMQSLPRLRSAAMRATKDPVRRQALYKAIWARTKEHRL